MKTLVLVLLAFITETILTSARANGGTLVENKITLNPRTNPTEQWSVTLPKFCSAKLTVTIENDKINGIPYNCDPDTIIVYPYDVLGAMMWTEEPAQKGSFVRVITIGNPSGVSLTVTGKVICLWMPKIPPGGGPGRGPTPQGIIGWAKATAVLKNEATVIWELDPLEQIADGLRKIKYSATACDAGGNTIDTVLPAPDPVEVKPPEVTWILADQIQGKGVATGKIGVSFGDVSEGKLRLSYDGKVSTSEAAKFIFPIEIIGSTRDVLGALNVAKLTEKGVLDTSSSPAVFRPEKDPDCFYVRIPGGGPLGITEVQLATVENPFPEYDDPGASVFLRVDGNDLISDAMVLVSDDDDDVDPRGGGDGTSKDRTFKVQLGGKLAIQKVTIGGAAHTVDKKLPVPIKKSVYLAVTVFNGSGSAIVDDPANAFVYQQLLRTRERYAQVGVWVDWGYIEHRNPPAGVTIGDKFNVEEFDHILTADAKAVLADLGARSADKVIHIAYIKNLYVGGSFANGLAISRRLHDSIPGNTPFLDNIFLRSPPQDVAYLTAHELAHILVNQGHSDEFPWRTYVLDPRFHLLHSAPQAQGLFGEKRFDSNEEAEIYKSPKLN